ncbi:MAG: L-asparaginase [Candidatus Jettenia ecosi]|uniref:L-asparaginase n=1 Tax=Candidatus Jettenia ecosi TaxID=2494326 RepID=A0A533QF92_9BACT|nr:MAG: L-asparaginase [Candidatus Jettenia ecosi]
MGIMNKRYQSNARPPILLVHGGAGSYKDNPKMLERKNNSIAEILSKVWPVLLQGESSVKTVCRVVELLEACPDFNAGLGSVIQSDGMARLSASLMDGNKQKFSGVLLATHIIHPSKLAYALQDRDQTVVGPLGAQLLARELGIPPQNPVTPAQATQWISYLEKQKRAPDEHGTVGAIALDQHGCLAAATSTGGSGTNIPERVSDSATVAGNYASKFAAISCTGIGEQIMNDGVAVKLETRVRDGRSIIEASNIMYEEANNRQYRYGWIGVDHKGNWVMYCTTEDISCGVMSQDMGNKMIFYG